MKISSISLTDFRNHSNTELTFGENLNVLIGKNAQGKTNLLEAIYFCAIGKSTRVSKEKEVILHDKELARISLIVQKKFAKSKIDIYFSKKEKKTIKINGIPIKRIGELMGEFNAVYFSPDELKLVKDSPEDRRRFMDIDISQTSKMYFYNLGKYEKILANRNKLLKDIIFTPDLKNTIAIWDEQLATVGAKIVLSRIEFLKKLTSYAELAHSYLTNNAEKLELSYQGINAESEEKIKAELLSKYTKNIDKDLSLGYTTVGPHRDDIKIIVDGTDLKLYGSQGQQRTCALALKLAELEIIREKTGELPVLLLDDVLSELDNERRERLINFTAKTQTIITCNQFDYYTPNTKFFVVENGKIRQNT